jgi:hypothetical protein
MGAALFWAFARDLFEDDAPGWKRFAPALLLLAVGIVAVLSPPGVQPFSRLAHNLIGFALVSHILFLIASGWRGDLVEKRRRLRGPVLLAGAAYALAVIIDQTFELMAGSAEQLSPSPRASHLQTVGLKRRLKRRGPRRSRQCSSLRRGGCASALEQVASFWHSCAASRGAPLKVVGFATPASTAHLP